MITKIPLYREITKTKYYDTKTDLKAYSWTNRNKMVFTYPYFETGKTGYTPSAGKTLVTTSRKDNLELTIVSLNDDNHYKNQIALYNEMFDKYQNHLLVSKNEFNKKYSDYYIKEDIYYPLTKQEKDNIDIRFVINNNSNSELILSLNNNEILREIIYLRDKKINKNNQENIFVKIKKFIQKIL